MSHVSPITTLWSISDSGNYKSRTERPQSVAFYQGKKKWRYSISCHCMRRHLGWFSCRSSALNACHSPKPFDHHVYLQSSPRENYSSLYCSITNNSMILNSYSEHDESSDSLFVVRPLYLGSESREVTESIRLHLRARCRNSAEILTRM